MTKPTPPSTGPVADPNSDPETQGDPTAGNPPVEPPADPPVDQVPADTGKAAADAELARWKAQARANEQRAKENADKAKKYDDVQRAGQSAEERAATAEAEAAASKQELTKYRVAADLSVPPELHEFLTAQDEAGLRAQAEKLLTLHKAAAEPPPGGRRPKPDPGQGARPGDGPDIDQQIRDAEARRDVQTAIRLKNQKQRAAKK